MLWVGIGGGLMLPTGAGFLYVSARGRGSSVQRTSDLVVGAALIVIGLWALVVALVDSSS